MVRAKKPSRPFQVLSLPSEIRLQIWTYVVVSNKVIEVRNHDRAEKTLQPSRLRSGKELEGHRVDDLRRVSSQFALASTCRQLYLEVAPIYYSKNHFRLERSGSSKDFAAAIGQNSQRILSIYISYLINQKSIKIQEIEAFLEAFPANRL